jgi:hypothetical protein
MRKVKLNGFPCRMAARGGWHNEIARTYRTALVVGLPTCEPHVAHTNVRHRSLANTGRILEPYF